MKNNPDAGGAAEIAGQLTKAQREAICSASYGGFGFPVGVLFHAGKSATGTSLFRRDLVDSRGRLTPLGLEVRALLASKDTRP